MIEEFLHSVEHTDVSVAVIGDCMLDEYYHVKVERISPEAPCPVFATTSYEADVHLPGGAGNVCYQMRDWPVDVQLYGIMDDQSKKHYDKYRINTDRCPLLGNCRIPIKRRYMSGDTQVARLDIESEWYGTGAAPLMNRQTKLAENFEKDPEPNVLILSDYGKGVFANGFSRNLIKSCHNTNIKILVDPKDGPIDQWYGCTIFKPNYKEAVKLSGGLVRPQEQADYFMEKLGCDSVVITHSGEGVTGKIKDKYFEYLTPNSHGAMKDVAVRSVCGAGDCFVAFLSMAVGVGIPVDEAAKIAFEAGAVYVTHRFNSPVQSIELLRLENPIKAKIKKASELAGLPQDTVFTNGCFDLLHPGHIETLRFAKSKGSCLVVGINSDESVRRLKGETRPIMTQDLRSTMLASLQFVDYVVVFEEDTPRELIKLLQPRVLVKGDEYDVSDMVGADLVEQVCGAPMYPGFSTTGLIQKIKGE